MPVMYIYFLDFADLGRGEKPAKILKRNSKFLLYSITIAIIYVTLWANVQYYAKCKYIALIQYMHGIPMHIRQLVLILETTQKSTLLFCCFANKKNPLSSCYQDSCKKPNLGNFLPKIGICMIYYSNKKHTKCFDKIHRPLFITKSYMYVCGKMILAIGR